MIPLAWRAGAAVLALAMAYGAGRLQQHEADAQRLQAQRLAAVEAARVREHQWQTDAAAAEETHDEELRRIAAAHDADLDRLRQRPDRMPAPAAAACAGASGSQLSRDDAAFLIRFAAERDATAADLRACQAWIKAVTGSQDK